MHQDKGKMEVDLVKQIDAMREDNLQIIEHYNKLQAELEDRDKEVCLSREEAHMLTFCR